MKTWPALTALILLLFVQLLSAADHGDVTDVSEIDRLDLDGPYERIWQPHLARWTDRHLVTCYGLELRGKSDMGDIVCSISTDGGKTWSPRAMVFDHRHRTWITPRVIPSFCMKVRLPRMTRATV